MFGEGGEGVFQQLEVADVLSREFNVGYHIVSFCIGLCCLPSHLIMLKEVA